MIDGESVPVGAVPFGARQVRLLPDSSDLVIGGDRATLARR